MKVVALAYPIIVIIYDSMAQKDLRITAAVRTLLKDHATR